MNRMADIMIAVTGRDKRLLLCTSGTVWRHGVWQERV